MKLLRLSLIPLLLTVLGIFVFRAAWPADQIVQSSDFNVGVISIYKRIFPTDWFSGSWTSTGLLGVAASRPFNLTNLLIVLLPLEFFCDWGYAIHLILASSAFAAFLRLRGVSFLPALVGTLTAFWLGSNLTLIYPGHLYKYGVLTGAAFFLWLWEMGLSRSRWPWFVLAGGAFGLMFLEQQDLAVFCAVLLGPYALWRLWATESPWARKCVFVGMTAVPALLMMSDAYFKARTAFIDPVAKTQTPEEKWGWATQWSWPPSESVDFIAPGFYGLRSGEPGAEYWGEMGRSPGWEKTGQGFKNFKLESQYVGIIPIALAFLALLLAFTRREEGEAGKGELRFWAIGALILLGLSCGKYTPLYKIFYSLPMMDSIRNPNKFLQVFQLALGVLAAHGADALLGTGRPEGHPWVRRHARAIPIAFASVAGLLLAAWLVGLSTTGERALKLASEGYAQAGKLSARASHAMGHGAVMAVLLALGVGLISYWKDRQNLKFWIGRGLIGLMVLDILWLSQDYIVAQNLGTIRDTPVANFLQKEAKGTRVHVLDPSGLNNHLMTYVFPYAGVDFINLLAAPRLHSDADEYLGAIGRNIVRQWNHFGVSHVLVSASQWEAIRATPALAAVLQPVFGWAAVADTRLGFRFIEVPLKQNPPNLILRYLAAPGRYRLVGAWKETGKEEVLAALKNPMEETDARVWVEKSDAPPLSESGAPGTVGTVEAERGINHVSLKARADRPALLVLADQFNPAIDATVNHRSVPIRRVNHLLVGVEVPAGDSDVVLQYRPPRAGVLAVQSALVLCLLAAISLLMLSVRTRRKKTS